MSTSQQSGLISKLPTTYSYVVNYEPKKKSSLRNLKQKITSKKFTHQQTLLNVLQNYKMNKLAIPLPPRKSKSSESKGEINKKLSINQQQSKLELDKNNFQKVCQFKLTIAQFDNTDDDTQIVYQIQLDKIL